MAALEFLTPIDLHGNEARNFAHQTVGVLPDASTRKFHILGYINDLYWSDGIKWLRVGTVTDLSTHSISELGPPTKDLSFYGPDGTTSFKITNLADAVSDTDAANLKVVKAEIAKVVDAAPELLDTLKELADALNNDPDFANNVLMQLSDLDARIDALESGTAGSLARKFAANIGNGTATSYVLLHNLNTFDVTVSLYDTVTRAVVLSSVEYTSKDTITVAFSQAPVTDAYRAVVVG